MLTGTVATAPFTMGNPAITGPSSTGPGLIIVVQDNPATTTGTITTINFYTPAGGTVMFLVVNSSSTVTAVTGSLSASAGLNTYSVSLAVPPGGANIAVWSPSSGGAQTTTDGGATGHGLFVFLGSAPTVSQSLTGMSPITQKVSLQALGT